MPFWRTLVNVTVVTVLLFVFLPPLWPWITGQQARLPEKVNPPERVAPAPPEQIPNPFEEEKRLAEELRLDTTILMALRDPRTVLLQVTVVREKGERLMALRKARGADVAQLEKAMKIAEDLERRTRARVGVPSH